MPPRDLFNKDSRGEHPLVSLIASISLGIAGIAGVWFALRVFDIGFGAEGAVDESLAETEANPSRHQRRAVAPGLPFILLGIASGFVGACLTVLGGWWILKSGWHLITGKRLH